ncbi:MAG: phosphatase [Clostridia bacterium]|nr:phosphatase [Clostridia bacterium]
MHLEADLHTHTVASGHAYSTIKEMAEAAAEKGLKILAVTDHGLNMPGGPHYYYFTNLRAVPRCIAGVEILKGVEANIIDKDGHLDMPERLLRELDWVGAGFHDGTGYVRGSIEENTWAMIAALRNPYVHFIVHPGNPDYPVDLEKIVLVAKALGKALEINNNSFSVSRPGSKSRCELMARLVKKHGGQVVLNSDAHIFSAVGVCGRAVEVAMAAGIEQSQILNSSAGRVRQYLMRHRIRLEGILESAEQIK